MTAYTAKGLKEIMADMSTGTRREIAREAVKLVNRREYTALLRAILLAALLILDEKVNTHWEDETTPVIEFLW